MFPAFLRKVKKCKAHYVFLCCVFVPCFCAVFLRRLGKALRDRIGRNLVQ